MKPFLSYLWDDNCTKYLI